MTPAPTQAAYPFPDQVADALDFWLARHRSLVTQIRRHGPTGLLLECDEAEKRIVALTCQLAEVRAER